MDDGRYDPVILARQLENMSKAIESDQMILYAGMRMEDNMSKTLSCREAAINKTAGITGLNEKIIAEDFDFLDTLRDSGKTNMFGGVKYLQEYDGSLTRQQASLILLEWMDSYGKDED